MAQDDEITLDDESLAGRIRKAAQESGQSVYRLAQLADLDQSTLNKFLSGTRDNLRLDMADRLCRALGLELVSRAVKATERARVEKAKQRVEKAKREKTAKVQVCAYLEGLSMVELEALDKEMFSDPETRSRYDERLISMKQVPDMQRLYLDLLRKDFVRVKLNLPPDPDDSTGE